mgnify:CR=1 FL=1
MIELREYPQEEYEKDMKTLLTEKGLAAAVKIYLDKINEGITGTSYIEYGRVQEYLCDILFLVQEAEKENR